MYVCIFNVLFCVYVMFFLCVNLVKISKNCGFFFGLSREFCVREQYFFLLLGCCACVIFFVDFQFWFFSDYGELKKGDTVLNTKRLRRADDGMSKIPTFFREIR